MAKYSFQFKKKIVEEYFSGKGGFEFIAKKYSIPYSAIRNWVHGYERNGDSALLRSRKNKNYSFEYKLSVVEFYLSNEVSYQDLACQENINNPSLITKWVNDFKIAGPDALRPRKKGRKKKMDVSKQSKMKNSSEDNNISAERVKQLEDELLKLRIENAYLKELRRLRLEEEAFLKKQRELSTVSEENSN
ncbi:transposase [Faecalimonas sp.]